MTLDEMSINSGSKPWQVRDRLLEIHSPWVTVIRERLEDDRGQLFDYWRVEKADSAVIITQQRDRCKECVRWRSPPQKNPTLTRTLPRSGDRT